MGGKFKTRMYFPGTRQLARFIVYIESAKFNLLKYPWHQISSNKVLLFRRFKQFFVFLIDDLTTIEYLKLTLPVYLVHSNKVHERYKFFDYQKRQNKNSTFRAKALQYYDRRIQGPRWRTTQYDNHGQKQLILTCYENLK